MLLMMWMPLPYPLHFARLGRKNSSRIVVSGFGLAAWDFMFSVHIKIVDLLDV